MSEIINSTLGEVCVFVGGSQPAKTFFSRIKLEGYVRLIQIRDYKGDNFLTYIPENSTSKFCNKEDIMIGRYGPPIFQILRGLEGAYNVALMKAVPKKNIINNYLYYFLCQSHLFEYVNALSPRTGGQTGVDVVMLKQYPIKLPCLSYQKRIAKILSDLDTKIEINNKINQELEAMAKLLYDYWFVQFDFPNAEGKPYKTSGGKMVYNEALKREIPEGWKVLPISTWIKKDKSGDWGKDSEQGNYTTKVSCIRGADLNGLNGKGEVKSPTRFILEKNEHKILEVGDFIVEISGGSPTQSTGRMAFIIPETLERYSNPLICSNFCKAVTLEDEKSIYNFSHLWNQIYDAGVLFGWEGKTSGIKNLLFESFITNYKVVKPPQELMEEFYQKAKPTYSKIQKNLLENQKLAELRDWLLPMLMNGQVKVGE